MVQVGDWVRIHEDAIGFAPIPVVPVRVETVHDNGSIYVERSGDSRGGEEFFYASEFDVVEGVQMVTGDSTVFQNNHLLSDPGVRNESFGSLTITLPDLINAPPHYKIKGDMEVIDVIEALAKDDAWYANAIKYLLRAKKKGKLTEDLGKCKFYIDRMLRDAESEAK